jgi:aspartate/methionine/tyrosine aminotransferase
MPQGGPYLLINVSAVAESESFANYLLLEHGIRANPGWIFESAPHIRIPFGGTRETLSKLAERLSGGTVEWQRRLS